MEITTRYVLEQFLQLFKQQLDKNPPDEIDPFFENFFLKEELIAIVQSMYPKKELRKIPLWDFKKYELLEMIGNHQFILDFFLKQWEQERSWKKAITQKGVWDTLERLGQQTHYFGGKPLVSWNEYDHSNYSSMLLKCGKVVRVYGVYDLGVDEQDALLVDSLPKRFFPTLEMAESALLEIAREQGITKNKLKIIGILEAS